jgi:hypothetical protein
MTNILGKIAETLGLDGEDRNTNAAAAGNGGATEAGGAAGMGGLSMGGGVGGTPDDLAVGAAAAAADKVAQSTGGTEPIRSGQPDGSTAAGGLSTAGTDPITPETKSERSHDLPGGSGAH